LIDKSAIIEFLQNRVIDHHLGFDFGDERIAFDNEVINEQCEQNY